MVISNLKIGTSYFFYPLRGICERKYTLPPRMLWQQTHASAGISRAKFMDYFAGRTVAYAYQLGTLRRFKEPRTLAEYGIVSAPQSFVYIEE